MRWTLLGICAALRLIDPFIMKTVTRDTIFSEQIDNHFDEDLVGASVTSPLFLSISNRTVSSSRVCSLESQFATEISSIGYTENKLLVLDSSGILIYENIKSHQFQPKLLQYYRDVRFANYTRIETGKYVVLHNLYSFLVLNFDDFLFPVVVAQYDVQEKILVLAVIEYRIIVGSSTGLIIYNVIDEDLGVVDIESRLSPSDFILDRFQFTDFYVDKDLYLLEKTIGLLRVQLFPLSAVGMNKIRGEKIAGYKNTIIIDCKYELSLSEISNPSFKYYNITTNCTDISIDENFIYCRSENKILYISRLLSLVSESTYSPIYDIKVYNSLLFIAQANKVQVNYVSLGPLYIYGQVPDEVKEYNVKFSVQSSYNSLEQTFVLKVQYSLANVITFILVSFIGIFALVFISSTICRYITREKPETAPFNSGRDLVSDQPSERVFNSERILISR
jgi:hypothetical protein